MTRILFLLVFSIAMAGFFTEAKAEQRFVYLSAGGTVIVYQVDAETGRLTEIQANPGAGLTAITSDQDRLYRVGGGEIESYRIRENGELQSIGKNPTEATGGYLGLDATDRFIAGSNYGGGSVAVWAIGGDGIARGVPVAEMMLEKAAHSAAESGSLGKNDPFFVSGPTGENAAQQPRHLVFHPNGKIVYTTLERESPGVGVWKWDAEKGQLETIQNMITLPDGFPGTITTADLHLTPAAKFLYVSNRDLTDRKAVTGNSSIVGFRVDSGTGKLSLIGHTHCPQVPRAFAIDRAGEFLYAAGQVANKFEVFRIDPETGILTSIQMIDTGKGPNWVRCVTKP
jgi:6-phosphogluconolactonase